MTKGVLFVICLLACFLAGIDVAYKTGKENADRWWKTHNEPSPPVVSAVSIDGPLRYCMVEESDGIMKIQVVVQEKAPAH